ncbi:AraC family transcriptional regulator [Mucilaginibacter sp. UR6-11]|uniref:helix-turn-helix domain-containing protein n=1 Tax=Mucilaginibacter sp. UR6-11 TaxID=1435644 RepID=UPI001E381EFD|nr:AraC family transcriptional regulator [Mucilaginibacter sp. UR6-11]MCC8425825.1 AraC family transcriptional regulator [Mucilaginibacter sp. UR6-11]
MNFFNKYLFSSKLEEDWGFYTTTAGYAKIDINQSYPLNNQHPDSHKFSWNKGRVLDGYYIVFISRGEGVFESAKTLPADIKAGTCFLLFPGIWHRYKPNAQSGWEEYWIGFKGSYPDILMQNFNTDLPFITTGRNDKLLSLFQELLDQVKQETPGYHQVITGITLQILGLIQASLKYNNLNTNNTTRLIDEAKFLLTESIEKSDNIEQIISKLPVSYSKFRKDFKTITGKSPNQYQLDLKLNKAKNLLSFSNLTISEIADQVGFESFSYFSKIFKTKIGVSPGKFRAGAYFGDL